MIIGSSLAVIGVVVVGVSNLMFSSATSSDDGVFYIFNLG
jgi:hypothetical protein